MFNGQTHVISIAIFDSKLVGITKGMKGGRGRGYFGVVELR